jgi:hypothetical protein
MKSAPRICAEGRAHNGLVGGSSPPGPTIPRFWLFVFKGLAPELSNLIPRLDIDLFTIRPL